MNGSGFLSALVAKRDPRAACPSVCHDNATSIFAPDAYGDDPIPTWQSSGSFHRSKIHDLGKHVLFAPHVTKR
jgi:hypothetical protein